MVGKQCPTNPATGPVIGPATSRPHPSSVMLSRTEPGSKAVWRTSNVGWVNCTPTLSLRLTLTWWDLTHMVSLHLGAGRASRYVPVRAACTFARNHTRPPMHGSSRMNASVWAVIHLTWGSVSQFSSPPSRAKHSPQMLSPYTPVSASPQTLLMVSECRDTR